jgi:hypothetical protein
MASEGGMWLATALDALELSFVAIRTLTQARDPKQHFPAAGFEYPARPDDPQERMRDFRSDVSLRASSTPSSLTSAFA